MADCQSFRSESTICAAAAAANNRHVPRREPSTSSPPATTLIQGQLLAAPRQLQGNLGLFRGVGTAHAREPHRPEPDWASTGHGWFGERARGATAHTEPSTPSHPTRDRPTAPTPGRERPVPVLGAFRGNYSRPHPPARRESTTTVRARGRARVRPDRPAC